MQKIALTLKDLTNYNARGMKERSKACHATFKNFDGKLMRWTYHVSCSNGDPKGYDCMIQIVTEPWKKAEKKPESFTDVDVLVSCTDPSFAFWGPEYNSVKKKYNLPPLKGTAEPPKRNLFMADGDSVTKNLLCKHLEVAAQHMLKMKIRWPEGWFEGLKKKVKKLWPFGKKEKKESLKVSEVVQKFVDECSHEEDCFSVSDFIKVEQIGKTKD